MSVRAQVVLVVDDEVDILDSLKSLFESSMRNVRVVTAESGPAGLEVLGKQAVDLIITDYKMPGMNGFEFLEKAKKILPTTPRILITAFPDLDIAIKAINEAGIENFITKPFDPDKVTETVESVLKERRARELRDQSFARSLETLRKRLES